MKRTYLGGGISRAQQRGAADIKIILLVVVVVAGLVCAGMWMKTAHDRSVMETQKNLELQTKANEIKQLKTDQDVKEASITKLTTDLKKIKEEQMSAAQSLIKEKEDKIAELDQKVKDAEQKIEEAKKQAADLDKQVSDAKAQVDAKTQEAMNLQKIVQGKDEEIAKLNETVKEWQGKQKAAADLADGYKNRLLEHKIAIEPDKRFAGNVLVVNADPEFIILDLGAASNIPVGQELKVVRGNHYVGKIAIKKLLLPKSDRLSYATTSSLAEPNNKVQEGDVVTN